MFVVFSFFLDLETRRFAVLSYRDNAFKKTTELVKNQFLYERSETAPSIFYDMKQRAST